MTRSPLPPLTPDIAQRIFDEQIAPTLVGTRRARPEVVLIGGQPAAGKTTILCDVMAEFPGAASFDVDDFLAYHPAYDTLLRRDDRTAAELLNPDIGRWWDMAARHIQQHQFDAVIPGLGIGDQAIDRLMSFREAGYRTRAVFVATSEILSALRSIGRYVDLQELLGHGRWVPPEVHDWQVIASLHTASLIQRVRAADVIDIADPGSRVRRSTLRADGTWDETIPAWRALKRARDRPWMAGQITDFRQFAEGLTNRAVDDDLHPLIAAIRRDGEEHIARYSAEERDTMRTRRRARQLPPPPRAHQPRPRSGR